MAITVNSYGIAASAAFDGTMTLTGTTKLKVALMDSTYTPNQMLDENWDDISAYDIDAIGSPTNYTAGGKALTNVEVTFNNNLTGYTVTIDADNIVFPGLTANFDYAVIYYSNGAGTASPLLGWLDFGGTMYIADQTFGIQWNADGIMTLTSST
jgi:hypothetical protein